MPTDDANKRIVYTDTQGELFIVVPAREYLETHTIEELAAKDVPSGLSYHIVNESEIPSDLTFRGAWTWE